jgi:hypothetical protein
MSDYPTDLPDWVVNALKPGASPSAADPPASVTALQGQPSWPLLVDAAVVGAFLPRSLGLRAVDESVRPAAERAVLAFAETTQTPDGAKWLLRRDPRVAVLNAALSTGDLPKAIERTRTQFTDPFSVALRRCLEGSTVTPANVGDLSELEATRAAVAAVSGVTALKLPTLQDLDREVELGRLLAQFARMVGEVPGRRGTDRFFGRANDLNKLRDYCDVVEVETLLAGAARLGQRAARTFRGLVPRVVWGVGGVGKTTLVAKFMLEHARASRSGFPFAYLDFDRSTVNAAHPSALLIEMCVQVGAQFKELTRPLSDLRARIAEVAVEAESVSSSEVISKLRPHAQEFRVHIDDLLERREAEAFELTRPFLLVFDTFEVAQYSADLVKDLEKFVATLSGARPWTRLRLIIAGRSPVDGFLGPVEQIPLGALDLHGSVQMLMAVASDAGVSLSDADAAELVSLIAKQVSGRQKDGMHPLQLQLVGTVIRQIKSELEREHRPFTMQPLLDDLSRPNAGGLTGRVFVNSVLVRRILDHVVDERVKALADPGLVVRRITEGVIREVMAPSTNVPTPDRAAAGADDSDVIAPWQLSEQEARDIFVAFSKESTLIEADGDALRHRPDVRQEMLPLIRARHPNRFQLMHQRAFTYFSGRVERDPTDDRSAEEAIYHGLWQGEPLERLNRFWRSDRQFSPRIDADDFEPGSLANVFVRAKAFDALSPDEVRNLPRSITLDWLTGRSELLLQVQRVDHETMSVIRSAAGENFERIDDRAALAAAVARMLYRGGEWQDAMRLLWRVLDNPIVWQALSSALSSDDAVGARADYSSLFRTLVTILAKSGRDTDAIDRHMEAVRAAPNPMSRVELLAHAAIARARIRPQTLFPYNWRDELLDAMKQVPPEQWKQERRILRLAILILDQRGEEWLVRYAELLESLPRDRNAGSTVLRILEASAKESRPDLLRRLANKQPLDLQTLDEVDSAWREIVRSRFVTASSPTERRAFLHLVAGDQQEWVRPIGNAMTREFMSTAGTDLQARLRQLAFSPGPTVGAYQDGLSYAQTAYDTGRLRELAIELEEFGNRRPTKLSSGDYPRDVFELANASLTWHATLEEMLKASQEPTAAVNVFQDPRDMPNRNLPSGQFEIDVLPAELGAIQDRREVVLGPGRRSVNEPHTVKPFGLAFSGGGIRSATLNLGILQGLADLDLLKHVDYLSTVSGGGYIGSWFHGVIRKHCGGRVADATALLSPEANPVPSEPNQDPVSFLRKYSNYLAPHPGLYTTDSWVIVLIWLRNVLLNQLILLPALAAAVIAALLLVFVQQVPTEQFGGILTSGFNFLASSAALIGLVAAMWIMKKNLAAVVAQTFFATADRVRTDDTWERWSSATTPLLFISAVILGCANLGQSRSNLPMIVIGAGLVAAFGVLQLQGGFVLCYARRHGSRVNALLQAAWMVPASALATLGLLLAIWQYMPFHTAWFQITVAPVLVCASLLAGLALLMGLMGADYPDAAREWLATSAAGLARLSLGWVALFVIAVYGPFWCAWLFGHYGATSLTAGTAWVAITVAGVLAGRSAAVGNTDASRATGALNWLILIAPPLFMIGYLLLISFGVHQAFARLDPAMGGTSAIPAAQASRVTIDVSVPENAPAIRVDVRGPNAPGWFDAKLEPVRHWASHYYDVLDGRSRFPFSLVWLLLLCVGVVVVASRRININEFSMHHFYKNRLVRCYLGASNGKKRHPNPLTGFDPSDDFPLSSLLPVEPLNYYGPYPIVNTTLNLNAGIELAQQERKAASFVFTPTYCGFAPSHADDHLHPRDLTDTFDRKGYRPTKGYSAKEGPYLGSATAISGAAANPNSGYSTSGPMAFLLTVFDARLGWWLGNPRWREASKRAGPAFALWYLFAELFGQTTARSKFVNLSDGGHFDNIGLYELVRRRCRYIIVGDAEQEGDLTFGSLGGAIRKCRADFGVEIDINPEPIRLGPKGYSTAHCVMGTITYPEISTEPFPMVDGEATPATNRARGWLFYLKSSLTGDEPSDVIGYHSRFHEFPHQSTGDQFFSESQFESYRRLGLHILRTAFEGVHDWPHQETKGARSGNPSPGADLPTLFRQLTRKWYAPTPVSPDMARRLANDYSALMRTLRERSELSPLIPYLLAEVPPHVTRQFVQITTDVMLFSTEVIQLMENVYAEYQLEHAANRSNPKNAGWMQVFRQWMAERHFLYAQVWPIVKDSYNPLFQAFVEHVKSENADDLPIRP